MTIGKTSASTRFMRRFPTAAALAGVAALAFPPPGGAEDFAAGVGAAPPQLIGHGDLAQDVVITASISNGSGRLAKQVTSEAVLVFKSLITVQKARGQAVAFDLSCKATYINAKGQMSGFVQEETDCFYGGVPADGIGVPLKLTFKFRPDKGDPKGTEGFVVEVRDKLTDAATTFLVTYDWQGGQG